MIDEKLLKICLELIEEEYRTSRKRFNKFASPHEGIAILREEYKELERLVFETKRSTERCWDMQLEAKQIAAMALAFMLESCSLLDSPVDKLGGGKYAGSILD